MAELLLRSFDSVINKRTLHLVGHSLGGQLAGSVGQKVQEISNNTEKLDRITGLDPAGPSFLSNASLHHLQASDAEFVDIIHTDAGTSLSTDYVFLGYPDSCGHADFWPNNGSSVQPGCSTTHQNRDGCSHQRSVYLYAQSANKNATFNAVAADSWEEFKHVNPNTTKQAVMGVDVNVAATGDFYLQTNSESPFARGLRGISYEGP